VITQPGKALVSIGIPTCNRAGLLEQAVASLLAQDYPNLEIVISDNASEDATPAVCERLSREHPNIRHHRQQTRVPPFTNFKTALELTRGSHFMWAADDDLREPAFVSTLMERHAANPQLALAMCETQFRLRDGTKLPFFAQGTFWRQLPAMSPFERMLALCDHNYGDLIYGIYRREALLTPNGTALEYVSFINEIPIFLAVAAHGEIAVCSDALFLKTVGLPTYLYGAREFNYFPPAGELPAASRQSGLVSELRQRLRALLKAPKNAIGHYKYHRRAWADIARAIDLLGLQPAERQELRRRFQRYLSKHYLKISFAWRFQDVFLPRPGA
jgi:glycosyltransferase involved in cell wall biosynthesis